MFKKNFLIRILPLSLTFTVGTASAATTIFNDNFNDGTTGNWYTGETSGTLSNSGTSLSWAENGTGGAEVIGRSFDTTTLQTGETLRLMFNYTMTSSVSILRAGLYDTQNAITANNFQSTAGVYNGYYTFLRNNSTSDNNARFEDNSSNYIEHFGSTIGSNATQFDMQLNTEYLIIFNITRTTASQIDTLITFNSSDGNTTHMSVAGSTTTDLQNSFDGAFIRTTDGSVVFDNISAVQIPEPGTVSLLALGGLAMLRRRRS